MSKLPRDKDLEIMQLAPTGAALARNVITSLGTAVPINLNSETDFLRCYAKTQDVWFKWGTTAVTTSNFDEVIPAGQIIDLPVPRIKNTGGAQKYTSFNVKERDAGASIVIIQK